MRNHALILTLAVLIGTPALASDWKPAGDRIKTRWAADVTPDNAWQEYPRPQMVRNNWQNLNGLWNYAVVTAQDNQDQTAPTDWAGKILVPFCLESSLSGVGRLLEPGQQLWYRRDFEIDKQDDQRTILHFEAVDYECQVWVNAGRTTYFRGADHAPQPFVINFRGPKPSREDQVVWPPRSPHPAYPVPA